MNFPYAMLLEFVQTSLDPYEVGALLTMAGFELEGISEVEGEPVLDIKTMANRGDGLSVLGLAREVMAKDPASAIGPTFSKIEAMRYVHTPKARASSPLISVEIDTTNCLRYAGRVFEGVSNGPSPDWLQKRLRQCGMRPISLLVDLSNYVMIETGQPTHAFDFDRLLDSKIVIREARPGETITTLDGEERELTTETMLICSGETPVAIAGVMGGQDTECRAETARILLESAHFDPGAVRRARKELGLSTEASYRFERWVDPEGAVAAIGRYAQLLAECLGVDGAKAEFGNHPIVDSYPNPPQIHPVSVRAARWNLILGMEVPAFAAKEYLDKLGFGVDGISEPLQVVPPSWRPDVLREEDVIEEIGRIHGYERIPERLPQGTTTPGGVFGASAFTDAVRRAILGFGYTQIVSHTIREAGPLDFTEDWRVRIRNPISPEQSLLRDSVLPGLAEAARRNGARDLHLFEVGRVFVKGDVQIDESQELGILSVGALAPSHWASGQADMADFYSLKGTVEELAKSVGVRVTFDLPRNPDRRFHPTRQAGVLDEAGRLWVGTIGQIHPEVAELAELPVETQMAELDLVVLGELARAETHFRPISRNPAVRRDLSFHYPKQEPFARFESAIRDSCGELLEDLWVFDVYEGKNIPEGHRNVAVAVQLRAFGENLTDEAANRVRDKAAEALRSLGATLR